jgi:hypothetical protein
VQAPEKWNYNLKEKYFRTFWQTPENNDSCRTNEKRGRTKEKREKCNTIKIKNIF